MCLNVVHLKIVIKCRQISDKALRQLPKITLEFYVHIMLTFTNQDYVAALCSAFLLIGTKKEHASHGVALVLVNGRF